jgi:hypothetical protein
MKLWGGIFLTGAVLNIVLGWRGWPAVFSGHLADPDSYMRLERLRQGVASGHLVSVVARDQSGAGVLLEWSRLLDMLIWLLAAPFAWVAGWRDALFGAGIALGPLGTGALGMALAFAARPLAEDRLLWTAAVAAAVFPGLRDFAPPGAVNDHILLLALTALCAGGTLRGWRAGNGTGFFTGCAGGFAVWLTPVTLPFVLLAFLPLLIRWLNRPAGALLAATAAGFADVLAFGYMVDPPQGGYLTPEVDRMSVVYLALGFLLLLGSGFLWRLQRWDSPVRRVLGVALLAGLLAAWVALFPQLLKGPYGWMDAADRRIFLGMMPELRPLQAGAVARYLAPGALALAYALWRAATAGWRWPWLYLAVCLAVALVLGDRCLIFAGFSAAAAACLLPVALSEAASRFRTAPSRALTARFLILAALFLPPEVSALARTTPAPVRLSGPSPSCDLVGIAALLGADKNTVVLAAAQDTPELLYRTPVETVGSLYQRGMPGYLRLAAAWASPPGGTEPPAVKAAKAKLVLFCRRPQRTPPVAGLPDTTLWDALEAGQPPAWLHPRGQDPATGWQVFEIR